MKNLTEEETIEKLRIFLHLMLKSSMNVSTMLPISFHAFSADGHISVHIVLAEDYCFGSQDEVQTAYFNITQSHFASRCYVLETLKFLDAQEYDFCL